MVVYKTEKYVTWMLNTLQNILIMKWKMFCEALNYTVGRPIYTS